MSEAQTLTLTEFLLARIAEDETVAEDALERGFGGWEYHLDVVPVRQSDLIGGETVAHLCRTCDTQLPADWQP